MPPLDLPHFPQGKSAFFKKLVSFKFYRSSDAASSGAKSEDTGKLGLSTDEHPAPAALGDIPDCIPNCSGATSRDAIQPEYTDASRASEALMMPMNSGEPNSLGAMPDGDNRNVGGANINREQDRTTQSATSGVFNQAHDFEINNSVFNEFHGNLTLYQTFNTVSRDGHGFQMAGLRQGIETGRLVLFFLNEKRVSGAEVRSEERSYPPRCNLKTRTVLRGALEIWLMRKDEHHRNFIWLAGPAGAGKSAVAQTFAEHCIKQRRVGAAFFFSRLVHRANRMIGLIPTIAYQLAVQYEGYRHIIAGVIANDPAILDQSLQYQFQNLISKPFTHLAAHGVFPAQNVPVIIIDGLDECRTSEKEQQKELVRLIVEFVNSTKEPFCPLLWLVCSRPESHIKATFLRARPPFMYHLEEVTCDTVSDRQDVYYILEDGLQKVYSENAPSNSGADQEWPEKPKLRLLAQRIGGLPILASTVVRFIGSGGDGPDDGPDRLLEICLSFLEGLNELITHNPLKALDTFYAHIMSLVQPSCLFAAKQIMSFCIMTSTENWENKLHTALDIAIYLGLSDFAFYNVLERLHSVLRIPDFEEVHKQPLRFFHKSFSDFFQNLNRSQEFGMDLDQARYEVARLSVPHYNRIIQANCKLDQCDCNVVTSALWKVPGVAQGQVRVREFVRTNFWTMVCAVDVEKFDPGTLLKEFNFYHLPYVSQDISEQEGLRKFMTNWVPAAVESQKASTLVRFRPMSREDTCLHNVSFPVADRFPGDVAEPFRYAFAFNSFHRHFIRSVLPSAAMVFWIGDEKRTALGFLFRC